MAANNCLLNNDQGKNCKTQKSGFTSAGVSTTQELLEYFISDYIRDVIANISFHEMKKYKLPSETGWMQLINSPAEYRQSGWTPTSSLKKHISFLYWCSILMPPVASFEDPVGRKGVLQICYKQMGTLIIVLKPYFTHWY